MVMAIAHLISGVGRVVPEAVVVIRAAVTQVVAAIVGEVVAVAVINAGRQG